MSPTQNLVQFIFITQFSAILLLIVAYAFDYDTYSKVSKGRLAIVPGLVKVSKLFGLSKNPKLQVLYFFTGVMILFSYVAFILLIIYTIGRFTGLL